jgi:hypothetical protein
LFHSSQRYVSAFLVAAATTVFGHAAHADAVDGDFAIQRFDPAPGPRNYFSTRGARTDGQMAFSAGLMINYAYKPFEVRSCVSETDCGAENARRATDTKVIENLVTGDLMAALAIIPRIQLGLRVPITWVKGQGINETGGSAAGGLSAVGVGDAMLEGKFRLYGEVNAPFVIGARLFFTGPLGHLTSEGNFIGDTLPSAGGGVIVDGEQGPWSFGANLTGVFRDEATVGSTTIGPEFRYNVAAGFRLSPVVRVIAEGFGTTRFSAERGENMLEVLGGGQFTPLGSPITITAGVGTGVVEGIGVPTVRVVGGLLYSFESRDRDQDGIGDASDACPTEAEDRDGAEDSDGCPDNDNDLDTIPDSADKCPSQAEDQDGFEDADGCPDADNDKDGLADVSDQCPLKAETKNNYKDEDGCPDEADKDNDGVPDERDKCAEEAEDTDGFEDTDGCPDPDNDKDGVLDGQDECVDEPETVNQFEDEDGCPDEAKGKKR